MLSGAVSCHFFQINQQIPTHLWADKNQDQDESGPGLVVPAWQQRCHGFSAVYIENISVQMVSSSNITGPRTHLHSAADTTTSVQLILL